MLSETNPEIFNEFKSNGNLNVKRTKNLCSAMGLDQLFNNSKKMFRKSIREMEVNNSDNLQVQNVQQTLKVDF